MKTIYFLTLTLILCSRGFSGEFPIGIYSLDPIDMKLYQEASASGLNYVFCYVNILTQPKRVSQLLDTAEKSRMKVALQVVRGRQILDDPEHFQKLKTAVCQWKTHPALGMWYLFDEPAPELRPALKKIYQMLKSETPDIPVALCLSWIKGWWSFQDCADILMPDLYPVKNQTFPNAPLDQFSKFVWSVKRLKKPVMPIAQIMSFANYPDIVKVDPESCREPTAKELRYFTFAAMTMNICGISYYSFWDLRRQNRMPYFRETGKPLFLELKAFAEMISGMKFQCHNQKIGKGYPPDFLCSSWHKDGKRMIVFVNNTPKTAGGTFHLEDALPNGRLKPWGQTRKAGIQNLQNLLCLDHAEPWEVFIWQLTQETSYQPPKKRYGCNSRNSTLQQIQEQGHQNNGFHAVSTLSIQLP